MIGVLSHAERHDQMQTAIHAGFTFMEKAKAFHDGKLSIVCYGPTLLDTWQSIQRPVMTVSGAHDFLIERGIVPDFHVECDPRQHKAAMMKRPQESTEYLMASVCHPDFWEILDNRKVQLWHLINGEDLSTVEWVANHHPAGMSCLIGGGSTVGQRAMNVAAALGYRRFRMYGMDCSFTDKLHAGEHSNPKAQIVTMVTTGNRVFKTTKQLLQSAREMEQFLLTADAEVEFYGDGLMQELARILKTRKVTV